MHAVVWLSYIKGESQAGLDCFWPARPPQQTLPAAPFTDPPELYFLWYAFEGVTYHPPVVLGRPGHQTVRNTLTGVTNTPVAVRKFLLEIELQPLEGIHVIQNAQQLATAVQRRCSYVTLLASSKAIFQALCPRNFSVKLNWSFRKLLDAPGPSLRFGTPFQRRFEKKKRGRYAELWHPSGTWSRAGGGGTTVAGEEAGAKVVEIKARVTIPPLWLYLP
ncbi:hypothetical protein DFH09DRAFT_1097915 [Mycena vulgaris]|nr:hypothetical protein DFH09DRAFT_1097915 [Mycena vulgaris]